MPVEESADTTESIAVRSPTETTCSWLSVGAETMDRDYTVYGEWREHLGPLGVTKARLQGGWEKTESTPGLYDFRWLDEIVFDMDDQGVTPWMCLCYGNTNIDGGGGSRLGASAPSTDTGQRAWLDWVRQVVARYGAVIDEWEVWNEPNNVWMDWDDAHTEGNAPETYADLYVSTGRAIRALQPDAILIAMSLAGTDPAWCHDALAEIAAQDALDLVDEITYHPYSYNPDAVFEGVAELRAVVDRFDPSITLRQGENGAPSEYGEQRALSEHEWTETAQAKWALRRLLADRARGIPSSYFQIMDMHYPDEVNRKGLLYSEPDQSVGHRKEAFDAVRHLAAVFDDGLEPRGHAAVRTESDRSLAAYGFERRGSAEGLVALWFDDEIPADDVSRTSTAVTVTSPIIRHPVLCDLRTGDVWSLPDDAVTRSGSQLVVNDVPLYDSPVLLADAGTIPLAE